MVVLRVPRQQRAAVRSDVQQGFTLPFTQSVNVAEGDGTARGRRVTLRIYVLHAGSMYQLGLTPCT